MLGSYEAGARTSKFAPRTVIEFSVAERQKRKGRKPFGSGPENLLERQVYGPDFLALKTTKQISTQEVIYPFSIPRISPRSQSPAANWSDR